MREYLLFLKTAFPLFVLGHAGLSVVERIHVFRLFKYQKAWRTCGFRFHPDEYIVVLMALWFLCFDVLSEPKCQLILKFRVSL